MKPLAWKTSTHVFAVPLQWSVASQRPPVEVPEQVAAADAKASPGHALDDPVQVSATSHWPADARQVKLDDWKTSTHELLVPVQ